MKARPIDAKKQLSSLAAKYIWWKSADEALRYPQKVIATIMDKGSLEDIQNLRSVIGKTAMRNALARAEPGQFRPQSWSYWQYKLNGLFEATLPALPKREFK